MPLRKDDTVGKKTVCIRDGVSHSAYQFERIIRSCTFQVTGG